MVYIFVVLAEIFIAGYSRMLFNRYQMNCRCLRLYIVWERAWIIIYIVCFCFRVYFMFELHPNLVPISNLIPIAPVLFPCSLFLIGPSTPELNSLYSASFLPWPSLYTSHLLGLVKKKSLKKKGKARREMPFSHCTIGRLVHDMYEF